MALAAAARRSLASRISGRFHPALSHLLTAHCSGDAATTPCPLHSPRPLFQSSPFPLPQSPRSPAQTLALFPFGVHLAGAGLSRRGFSSLPPPYPSADAGAVLTDAAASPAAPASFPSEVAWIAEESSSLTVEAVQSLISAVHSFTGLNWWLSIAVSTVLLRSVSITLLLTFRKKVYVVAQELLAILKLFQSAKDEKSEFEAVERTKSVFKSLAPPAFTAILSPYTFMALYFAISNMVEKLPSFREGGAFWFIDLTTPDDLYIFPAMASASLLLGLEFRLHYSKTKRSHWADVLRMLCVLTFPFAASFPKAICCYYITWSFVSLAQTIVFNQPAVKKTLFSKPDNPICPSSEGPTVTAPEDSLHPVNENEQPVPPEERQASDSIVDLAKDESDKKSETGPTADDSPHHVHENEQPIPPEETGEASDSSVDQSRHQSDKKPKKVN